MPLESETFASFVTKKLRASNPDVAFVDEVKEREAIVHSFMGVKEVTGADIAAIQKQFPRSIGWKVGEFMNGARQIEFRFPVPKSSKYSRRQWMEIAGLLIALAGLLALVLCNFPRARPPTGSPPLLPGKEAKPPPTPPTCSPAPPSEETRAPEATSARSIVSRIQEMIPHALGPR
jgi:hypothetical protein